MCHRAPPQSDRFLSNVVPPPMNCAGFCATLKLMAVQFFDIRKQSYLFPTCILQTIFFFCFFPFSPDSPCSLRYEHRQILFIVGSFGRKGSFIHLSFSLYCCLSSFHFIRSIGKIPVSSIQYLVGFTVVYWKIRTPIRKLSFRFLLLFFRKS